MAYRALHRPLLLLTLLLAAACGGESAEGDPVSIAFGAVVGEAEFACGTVYPQVGSTAASFEPSDLRFFVSEVALIDGAGQEHAVQLDVDGTWQLSDVALIDLEDGSGPCANGNARTHREIVGRVAAGEYVGLAFTVGVPFERNHGNPDRAPAPLSGTAMSWGWQAGYKFVRLEGSAGETGADWRLHLGSTGCEGTIGNISGCARPNRARVVLPVFDVAADRVVLDLGALLAGTDLLSNAPGTSLGCMGEFDDADCAAVFARLGVDATSGDPMPGQSAFVVRSQAP